MTKAAKTFKQIRIGQTFSFRFGHRGERAGWRKISARRYEDLRDPARKTFTVGTTAVAVR